MNKAIIIPDVHGRPFWRKVLDNKEDTIIFLGDYSDPYEIEGFTHEDCLKGLADIIQFKKDNPERVTLLLGNHDTHYLYPNWACWRFSKQHYSRYNKLYKENIDLFQMAWEINANNRNCLFTHAGMSIAWSILNESDITWIDDSFSETLNRTWKENPKVFNSVGRYRGGDSVGSPIWADVREHDTQGISDTTIQIFGHTQLMEEPFINGNMWCVDCQKVFMLEDGELKEY